MLLAVQVSGIKAKRKFRRPHDPQTDGPFLLGESDTPTRMREIAEVIRCQVADSGLSPGEYESMPSKDYTSHHAPKFSVRLTGSEHVREATEHGQ